MDPETPNETQRSIVTSFFQHGQDDVLAPYVGRFLDVAGTAYERLGTQRASTALRFGFPTVLASPGLLADVDAWLATTQANANAVRYVTEGRSEVARALAARTADADAAR
ncbi:Aminopeptidase N [Nocardioides aquaticus]|uniref:Aminopeptidase N n=1 Tax=Nocardioides aquaticus TaxID=160826 RepID=A0ABX8ELM0_9ACTN|nr:Aminopeptidase N [Nocardioides aquaticus]